MKTPVQVYLRGALAVGVSQAAAAVAGVAALWLLARILTKEDLGGYLFAMNVVAFAAAVAGLGLDRALMLRIAGTAPVPGVLKGAGLALRVVLIAAVAGTVLALGLALGAGPLVAAGAIAEARFWLPALAAVVVLLAAMQMMQAWFQANHRAPEAVILPGLTDLARAGLFALVLLAGGGAGGVAGAAIAAACLPLAALLWRSRSGVRWAPRRLGAADIPPAFVYLLQRLAMMALLQFDVILVGFLASGAVTAEYAVAARLAQFADFGRQALRPSFMPRIRRFLGLGDTDGAAVEYRIARVSGFLIALGLATGFAAFGPWLLGFFDGFEAAYAPLLILAANHVVRNGTGMHDDYLAMSGEVAVSTILRVVGLGLFVAIGIALIPRFGAAGAALSVLLAMSAINTASVLWLRARTGFAAMQTGMIAITAAAAGVLVAGGFGVLSRWETAVALALLTGLVLVADAAPRGGLRRAWGRRRRKPRS